MSIKISQTRVGPMVTLLDEEGKTLAEHRCRVVGEHTELDRLIAAMANEIERLTSHSTILNGLAWKLAQAMGRVPEGAMEIHDDGDPGVDLDVLIDRAERPLSRLMEAIYDNNVAHGWFEDPRSFGDGIALLHSEATEALEAYRSRGYERWTEDVGLPLPKPMGVGSELADSIIRALDEFARARLAGNRPPLDPDFEVREKMAFNVVRPHKHGGKKL